MSVSYPIPERFHDLLERPILCALTTINPDGQPHTVPVWCDYDGEHIRFNAPAATKKARNLQRNDKLSMLIIDPNSSSHWVEIQGHVREMCTEAEGARDHINKLAHKYTGSPVYKPFGSSNLNRQMYVVEATKVNGF